MDSLGRHNVLILEVNTFKQVLSIKKDQDAEITKIRDKLQQSDDKFCKFDKVMKKTSIVYWLSELKERIKEYIAKCFKCIKFLPKSRKRKAFYIPFRKIPF